MKWKMYAVFDSKAGVYDRPFVAHSDGVALRGFSDICGSADHPIGQHPGDYSLFRVGEWDDNTGVVKNVDREIIANGLEMVAQAQTVDPVKQEKLEAEIKAVN